MAEKTGKGAKILLVISVIVLAAVVLFTAAYALFLSPVTKLGGDKPASADKPADTPAAPETTPSWLELEAELDALIAAGPTDEPIDVPAPTGEPTDEPEPTDAPKPTQTPEPTPEPTQPPAQLTNPFKDVAETDWFYEPALWAYDKGILTGDTMSPNDPCTRSQAMMFLWREAGTPEPALQVSPFTDVTDANWYFKPVLWAFENGLISASTDGKFYPDNACTRAQIMLFLFRMEKGSADGLSSPYYDVPEGAYYHDAAVWAYHRGIVVLGDRKTFDADAPCTRGQFITFMYRCFAQ
ncbi:MAG: S-layer homology domain-containing protein [Oscillospiraceae bacterium]|nr:S-layer homology domain-containing protein [Oscillospiraceae bacterium]